MKNVLTKRLLALTLAAALVLPGSAVPVLAEEGETIMGKEETITVSDRKMERNNNFNENWKFYLGDISSASNVNFNDSQWDIVSVPHDFSIIQEFDKNGEAESGFLPGGTGWYRKAFILPESCQGKTIVLNFDGVYNDAYVYVNGEQAGENHYGYNTFAFDITDQVVCDGVTENVIAVKAVNKLPNSRWYSGSGIYRDVELIVTDPVHVERYGTKVTTPDIAEGKGTVQVDAEVVNDSDTDVTVTVEYAVFEKNGNQVAAAVSEPMTIAAGSRKVITGNTVVPEPKLWSTESPNLYEAVTSVKTGGEVTDTYKTTFGFRYYSFDTSGFHLNGENVKLDGVCMHHDQGALGAASYYDAMYRQLFIMKEMGANAIRTSHNPADEQFIEICDELGLLVIEEIFDGWRDVKNGNTNDFSTRFDEKLTDDNNILDGDSSMTWAEFVTKSAVKRDRNAPSVILWSIGNELQEGGIMANTWSYPELVKDLIRWVDEADGSRKTTIGDNNRGVNDYLVKVQNEIWQSGGVSGFNYANDSNKLRELAGRFGGVIIASETASATNSRGFYSSQDNNKDVDGKYHLTAYDTSAVQWGTFARESIYNTYTNDVVAGEFVWTGFDYIGEPTPWNGIEPGNDGGRGMVPNSSYFGIVDTTGFEKDTYYLYKSQWDKDAMTVHLVTAWDDDNRMDSKVGEEVLTGKTPVVVYTNAPMVKLYRNDKLAGTAKRTEERSEAGHVLYTYKAASSDKNICIVENETRGRSLFATFHVAYEPGTIRAVACDENGNPLPMDQVAGKHTVTTPGEASQLKISQDKTEILADGSSLAYLTVDVTDKDGNLDTTAVNTIHFSLTGDGEIVGVDNGDQATLRKFQQSSVLHSSTSAEIEAFSGKALVIVRSTKNAGSFTVEASADALNGGSATVVTKPVDNSMAEGLKSYTIVRDYTVRAGTAPVMKTTAGGTMSDGTKLTGNIVWDEIAETVYHTPGDYAVRGTLTFPGMGPISVTCRLHVIANVIAVRNIATATTLGAVPSLPKTVRGIMPDGTLEGEFPVKWNSMTEEMFNGSEPIVVIEGTAEIIQDVSLPVTASVRVGEKTAGESYNVAGMASKLTQEISKSYGTLEAIRNGTKKTSSVTDQKESWTTLWLMDKPEKASFTFSWDTAQYLGSVNLTYRFGGKRYTARMPETVEISYSLNGSDFFPIEAESSLIEEYISGSGLTATVEGAEYAYKFEKPISPVALRVTFTNQPKIGGDYSYVNVTECEVMTYDANLVYQSSADLSEIFVDGTAIPDFTPEIMDYAASGNQVTAASENNVGITVLPVLQDVVRILTVSEDGEVSRTYAVTLENSQECTHENTEVRGKKDAGCTEAGYTGDTFCKDCDVLLAQGSEISARGHLWDSGVVTKEPAVGEEGEMTYTCAVCKETRVEKIPPVEEVKVPEVSLEAYKGTQNCMKLTANVTEHQNAGYYKITEHGFIYQLKSRLGTRTLTVNTPGRTKVKCSGWLDEGEGIYVYNMKPSSVNTQYAVRSYVTYINDEGKTIYVYSNPIYVKQSELSEN